MLAQHIDAQIGNGNRKALTLDLGGVTFMDSSGLRALIELNERAQRDGRLALLAAQREPANLVLRLTGADTALEFEGRPRA